jgi:sugar lactone lactonase YvrE
MGKTSGLFVALVLTLPVQGWAQGPPLFVSTGGGHQILKVDGTSGATTVLFTANDLSPEGMAVGPDGRLWITDPTNGQVDVINQDGSNFQGVFFVAPVSPSGPSFDSAGDLFFNTKGAAPSGVFEIFAAAEWGSNPHCCVAGNILPATKVGSFQGEGTAIEQHGNLLVVDRSGSRVLLYVPSASLAPVIIDNSLSGPVGIAVDSVNRILVAFHDGHEIWRFDENGIFQDSYAIFNGTDYPSYMQFDASGNLYVVTADSTGTADGKVWKIAPCGGPPCIPTLLVDLGQAYNTGTIPSLASGDAIGVATPLVESAPQLITTETPTTFDIFNYQAAFTYPAEAAIPLGTTMRTLAVPLLPTDFATLRLANSALADECAAVSPRPGVPPNPCIVFRTQCFNGGALVSCPATTSADIGVQITVPPNPCTPIQNPGLLEAHDDQNNWTNIFRAATMSAPDANNLCTQTVAGATQAFTSDFVVTHSAFALAGTTCAGGPGHQTLPPIDADGSSVFKQGSTVPAKFRVCLPGDLNTSIGPRATVPTVVASFQLVQVISGTPSGTTESIASTTPDTVFRWDAASQQWIFNISTKQLTANNTYVFRITLSDGSTIPFQFGLK